MTRRQIWLCIAFASVTCMGCGDDGPKPFSAERDLGSLEDFLKRSMNRFDNPAEYVNFRIEKLAPISNDSARIEFAFDGRYRRDSFIEVDREKVLSKAGWNAAALLEARTKLLRLPAADTADLEKKNPAASVEGRYVRREGSPGDERHYTGNCTAHRRSNGWNFEILTVNDEYRDTSDRSYDLNDVRLPNVPPGGYDISLQPTQTRIREAVSEMQSFIDSVPALEKTIQERDELQFKKVKEATAAGRTWNVTAPDLNGNPTAWILEFIPCDQEKDPDLVRALLRNPKNDLERCVYDGKVIRAIVVEPDRYSRATRQGAKAVLNAQVGSQELLLIPANGERPTIRFDAKGETLRFQCPNSDSALAVHGTAPAAAAADGDRWNKLLERIKPAVQWSGMIVTRSNGNQRITLTVIESKPDGSYVRVLIEVPGTPISAAVYEGSCRPDQVHGWPLLLRYVSGLKGHQTVSGIFDPDARGAEVPLTMTLDEKGLVGRRGQDDVALTTSKVVEFASDRPAAVRAAFAAGAKYKGRVSGPEGEDLGEVLLDIAEVRDSGGYVRVLARTADLPYDVVVYEGQFKSDPLGQIDGYCLELTKRNRGSLGHMMLNAASTNIQLMLRLALDGTTVIGGVTFDRGRVMDTFKLSPVAADAGGPSLATGSFGNLIRSKVAKGAIWKGQYKWAARNKTADVMLRVVDSSDEELKLELTSPTLIGGRIMYEGRFQFDDLHVNWQFAMLAKTVGGKAPPPKNPKVQTPTPNSDFVDLFDAVIGRDRTLYLVMAPQGDLLYGLTAFREQFAFAQTETLTLRLITPPRTSSPAETPPTTSGAPVPTPSSTVAPSTTPFGATTPTAKTSDASSAGPARAWTSSDGKFTVTAGAVRLIGNNLTLRLPDGATVDVPLDRLSDSDQDYIRKNPPRGE